jgi:hypothetical protein
VTRAALALLIGLTACGPAEPPPVPQEFKMELPSSVTGGAEQVLPPGAILEPTEVRLQFGSVSRLHQGYFGDPKMLAPLREGIAGCALGPTDVLVSYDSEKRIGRIVLYADTSGLRCKPEATAKGFDLQPVIPVTQAMARYRDKVAAMRDYRVSNFRIGVNFVQGVKLCTLWSSGQYPPDGTTWSPCVDFAGVPHCGRGVAERGVDLLQFPKREDQEYLAKCFGY